MKKCLWYSSSKQQETFVSRFLLQQNQVGLKWVLEPCWQISLSYGAEFHIGTIFWSVISHKSFLLTCQKERSALNWSFNPHFIFLSCLLSTLRGDYNSWNLSSCTLVEWCMSSEHCWHELGFWHYHIASFMLRNCVFSDWINCIFTGGRCWGVFKESCCNAFVLAFVEVWDQVRSYGSTSVVFLRSLLLSFGALVIYFPIRLWLNVIASRHFRKWVNMKR